jgi:hypothetical protein
VTIGDATALRAHLAEQLRSQAAQHLRHDD